jgi:hypothetical protein
VKTLFRSSNAGCGAAVTEAIDWFFEHEDEGIILEDDCVAHAHFFSFVASLLERYRSDARVMCVTGTNVGGRRGDVSPSYVMSIYPLSGGWATWKRAWRLYDGRLAGLDEFLKAKAFVGHPATLAAARRWEERFRQVRDYGLDSWATAWTFACWANLGVTCAPSVNLVTNIGYGPDGSHTWDALSRFSNVPALELEFPLEHPGVIAPDSSYDEQISSGFYEIDPLDKTSVAESLARNLRLRKDDVRPHVT